MAVSYNKNRSVMCFVSAVAVTLIVSLIYPSNVCAQGTIDVPDAIVKVIEQVRVPALREGPVVQLLVAEGDRVSEGDLIARIDDRQPLLDQARAKSELETAIKAADSELEIQLARKKHELARSDLLRIEQARSMLAGSFADEEYENRRLQVERTKLEIEKSIEERSNAIAQAKLFADDYKKAELAVQLTRVVSPLSGVVVSIQRHQGEWARAGETVLEILGTTRLRAEALIDIKRIEKPLVGRRAVLLVAMPDGTTKKFRGNVQFESPEINSLDNRVSVWAEIANPDLDLRAGMRGRLIIDMSERMPAKVTSAVPKPVSRLGLRSNE